MRKRASAEDSKINKTFFLFVEGCHSGERVVFMSVKLRVLPLKFRTNESDPAGAQWLTSSSTLLFRFYKWGMKWLPYSAT